jgi:hypothetical protein
MMNILEVFLALPVHDKIVIIYQLCIDGTYFT